MRKLPKWLRIKICADPTHRKKHKSKIAGRASQREVSGVTTSVPDMSESEKRIVAATITGLTKVQRNSPTNSGTIVSGTGNAIAGKAATIAATRAASSAGSTRKLQSDDVSQVTYDHLGNEL